MLRELLINKAERLANSEQASKKRRSIKKIVSEQKQNLYRKVRKAKKSRDLDVRFQGKNLDTLKLASNELIEIARTIPGVTSLDDFLYHL